MGKCIGDTDNELGNLQNGEAALDSRWDAEPESSGSVVCILEALNMTVLQMCKEKLTMRAWTPELTRTNIHIGGVMYLIPAHIHIIAPVWW